eukprot:CAMPEP_0185849040 /NCGR_PEP_ID=MMETSP1354-20130828/3699_1 /TAXON_ID=708628 /ORGANISM="Erythrolobus madagascarensis, Strain CCMP3276" /LENGTH=243 /DNA_ID=CAMNT_0028549519 /DNA_START=57 /DNA_END=788 /DNA_ORIENTATION=+
MADLVVFGEIQDETPPLSPVGFNLPWENNTPTHHLEVSVDHHPSNFCLLGSRDDSTLLLAEAAAPTGNVVPPLGRLESLESVNQFLAPEPVKRRRTSGASELSCSTSGARNSFQSREEQEHITHRPSKRSRRSRTKASPARFCHLCWRKAGMLGSRNVELFTCAGYQREKNVCRKVECDRCLLKYSRLDSKPESEQLEYLQNARRGKHTCLHCQDVCPPTAQCKFYAKANQKRREMRLLTIKD